MGEEQQDRLTRVEMDVGYLKTSFGEIKSALVQLAEDMHKLAVAEAERAAEREAVRRIGSEVRDVKERLDKFERERASDELNAAKREIAARNAWVKEIGRTALTVAAALLLYHFGVKPL